MWLLVLFFLAYATAQEIPEYIKPCSRADPELDQCIATGVEHLTKYLITGIPEIGVPPIEPLVIPRIQLENGVGRIRVKAAFANMTIHGASNHTLSNIKSNIKEYKIEFALKAPRLQATGRYEVSGNVLVVNIRSKGDFWCQFDDVSAIVKLQGKEVEINGDKFMKIDKIPIDFKIGKARFKIKDRSNNNKILGEAINNFLNQNWREIVEEMKLTASGAIAKHAKQILNSALLKIPIKVWLQES